MVLRSDRDAAFFNRLSAGFLPSHLGIVITHVGQGLLTAELPVVPFLVATNGFLHGGTVVALADTAAGYGCMAHLPHEAQSFTTIELKTNFLGTAREGVVRCEARSVHLGRTTQVWDATVFAKQSDRPLAVFRATQMVLYPK